MTYATVKADRAKHRITNVTKARGRQSATHPDAWLRLKGQTTLVNADLIAVDDYKIEHFLNSYDHQHVEWTADGNGRGRDTRGVRGR